MDYGGIIEAAYEGILGRTVDPGGRKSAIERLSAGMALANFLKEIVTSTEFKETQPFINDVSQFGEVQTLIRLWINDLPGEKFVVDAGARGKARSNSYDFMRHLGWRGLLIEANQLLHSDIKREFDGTDFALVDCAVSDYNGEASFIIGMNDDVSSLSLEHAASWGEPAGQTKVIVRRLPEILQEHHVPLNFRFLSLDLEGEDVKVLNDLIAHSDYRPSWVVFEGAASSFDEIPQLCSAVKDLYAIKGRTYCNTIICLRHL